MPRDVTDRPGQASGSPPWSEIPVSTSMSPRPNTGRSTIASNASSSVPCPATSGRYQPLGGAGRRILLGRSLSPRRVTTRAIVRTDGTRSSPAASMASRMTAGPWSPRIPSRSASRTRAIRASTDGSVRRVRRGVVERSAQSTASRSSSPPALARARWTVPRPTPRRSATSRWETPPRTASTISRRRPVTSRCARPCSPCSPLHDRFSAHGTRPACLGTCRSLATLWEPFEDAVRLRELPDGRPRLVTAA